MLLDRTHVEKSAAVRSCCWMRILAKSRSLEKPDRIVIGVFVLDSIAVWCFPPGGAKAFVGDPS